MGSIQAVGAALEMGVEILVARERTAPLRQAEAFGVLVEEGARLQHLRIGQRTPKAFAMAVQNSKPLAIVHCGAVVVIDAVVR